jgi:hypothetical protein
MIVELNPELKQRELSPQTIKNHQEKFYRTVKKMAPNVIKSDFATIAPLKHLNYLEYLAFCYGGHYSSIVSPEHLWYLVLCNLANEVKENPEKYRSLFTDSKDKKEILVQTDDVTEISVSVVIEELRELVFFDMSKTLPKFSTSTELSELANGIAFCDMASPFFNYSTYLCGIPRLKILGTKEDWVLFRNSLNETKAIFDKVDNDQMVAHYLNKVWGTIGKIIDVFEESVDVDFFKSIFEVTPCGSGHQEEISGWITNFFMTVPETAYVENFLTCVSRMQYKNIETQRHFRLSVGLFASKFEDDFLVPEYGEFIEELSEGALMTDADRYKIVAEVGNGIYVRRRIR